MIRPGAHSVLIHYDCFVRMCCIMTTANWVEISNPHLQHPGCMGRPRVASISQAPSSLSVLEPLEQLRSLCEKAGGGRVTTYFTKWFQPCSCINCAAAITRISASSPGTPLIPSCWIQSNKLQSDSVLINYLRHVRYFPVQAPGMSQNLMEGVALSYWFRWINLSNQNIRFVKKIHRIEFLGQKFYPLKVQP